MFTTLRKRWAIRSYMRKLGPVLRRRCGRRSSYTPDEVRRAARVSGVNTDYLCYAYCIYCSREDFDQYHRQTGEYCNYAAMRQEIGSMYFRGNTSFDATDAIGTNPHSSESSWFGSENSSHSDSWGDSGNAGSGGGDGGSGGD